MARRGGKGIANSLANQIFRLQKSSGGNVPGDVVAAARRVKEGTGGEAELAAMRSYLGVHKSGSGALKGFKKSVKSVTDPIFAIQQQAQLASQAKGSGAVVAQARLFQTVNVQLQNFAKGKMTRRIVDRVAGFVSKDPAAGTRFINALGRGLRLGGAIGTALFGAIQIGQALVEGRGRNARAISAIKTLNRQFASDPRVAREIEKQTRDIAQNQRFIDPNAVYDNTGFLTTVGLDELRVGIQEYLGASISEDTQKLQQETLAARAKARSAIRELGGSPAQLLADYATQRGKAVSELTQQERNEALDQFVANNSDLRKYLDSEYVKGEFAKQNKLEDFKDSQSLAYENAKRKRFAQQYSNRLLQKAAEQAQERKRLAEETRRRRGETPGANYKLRVELEDAEARFNSVRSRHKSWSND